MIRPSLHFIKTIWMICSSMETTMECLREVQGKTALTFPVCHGQPLPNFIWTFRMPAAFFSRSLPLENTLNRMEKSCCRCPFRFIMLSAMDFISAALSMNANSLPINVKHGCNEKSLPFWEAFVVSAFMIPRTNFVGPFFLFPIISICLIPSGTLCKGAKQIKHRFCFR